MVSALQPTPDAGFLTVVQQLPPEEIAVLRRAAGQLRRSKGLVVRAADLLAGILGPVASLGMRQLNLSASLMAKGQGLAEAALRRAFDVAILGIRAERKSRVGFGDRSSRLLAAGSGAVSGLVGGGGFLPDVTFVTLLIMRRIAMIAADEGEDLRTEAARAACLEVFAFDAPRAHSAATEDAKDAELRYWTARLIMQGRPLVLLLSEVAGTYGVRVSQKLALQAVPLVGAAGAAIVNSVFVDHYQSLAHAHFAIRRLERTYGADTVRAAWSEVTQKPAS